MLRITIKRSDAFVRFRCPNCDSSESTYFEMPVYCWQCNYEHKADLELLWKDRGAREIYHLTGETDWGMSDATATRVSAR